ncbi:hypothetical protein BSZ35_00320, partial [Salinibacter sp. 10B]|uniref:hypothetical protein n=1 Tax=Salinibacter sp. 10B TaxID=1923971 RepID=UPI000D285638
MVPEILEGMHEAAYGVKQRRKERREFQQRFEKKRKRQEEQRRRRREEEKRREELERQAGDWKEAQDLRRYIDE